MSEENEKDILGVIVISHCRIAEEMIRATELIVGSLKGWTAISTQSKPIEALVDQLRETIKEVDQGKGVLIFTDLQGGTPANISMSFLGHKVEVICGMNLPMLIKVAQCQKDHDLLETARLAKEYGRRHIFVAGDSLSNSNKTSS